MCWILVPGLSREGLSTLPALARGGNMGIGAKTEAVRGRRVWTWEGDMPETKGIITLLAKLSSKSIVDPENPMVWVRKCSSLCGGHCPSLPGELRGQWVPSSPKGSDLKNHPWASSHWAELPPQSNYYFRKKTCIFLTVSSLQGCGTPGGLKQWEKGRGRGWRKGENRGRWWRAWRANVTCSGLQILLGSAILCPVPPCPPRLQL